MRKRIAAVLAIGLALATGGPVWAQALRGVGYGPSSGFLYNLPSNRINRTLESAGAYTRAGDIARQVPPQQVSYLAAPGIIVYLKRSGWRPVGSRDVGPGVGPVSLARVRSIDSLSFEKRGRFAKLRATTLALIERVREADKGAVSQMSLGIRQFMFPFPLLDQPKVGYGFFSRADLVGGGTVESEVFLAPFTSEVQQSLGEKSFLDLAQSMLVSGKVPDGMDVGQFYDTQLAALANYLFNSTRYGPAAKAWQVVAARDPKNGTARRALGVCFLAQRQMPQAAAEFRQSLRLAEGWPDKLRIAGSNLRDVFPNSRDLADARDELQAQLAKKPDDPDLAFLLAFLDLFEGRWDEAEKGLAALAPKDEEAKALVAAMKRGDVAPAIQKPLEETLRRLTAELTGLEEPPLSAEDRLELAQALREGPETYEEYMRVGDFRFFMGEFTQAGEAYRAAQKASPEDPFALFAQTHAAFANGEYRLAGRYLAKALAIEPNWGLFEFRLEEFYGDADEFTQHLRNLERQVEIRPKPELKFLLAYVYYFSGRYADATDLLAEVLRLEPGFQQANYFLRLARLQG